MKSATMALLGFIPGPARHGARDGTRSILTRLISPTGEAQAAIAIVITAAG
jgi:hypothetical protein